MSAPLTLVPMPDTLKEAFELGLIVMPVMGFTLTHNMVLKRVKTLTHRYGWYDLIPGNYVVAVEKTRGLKRNGKPAYIATLKIKSVKREPMNAMEDADITYAGFPEMNRFEFMNMLCKAMKVKHDEVITRIEFEYVNERNLKPFLEEIQKNLNRKNKKIQKTS